ncbi:MAG: hypothetical protein IT423_13990 [Pirellulaceae bacterium]|nr:hypothetical protein [Pirellulaceae bacterium]
MADPPDTWFGQHTQPQQRRDLQLHASASCSATACHGGPRAGVTATGAVRGSEYPLWLSSDPHARSWRTLCSDKSVAILNRLEILKNGHIADQAGFDNCLACHNSTQHFQESRTTERITEGIGCSSCHGPDQLWHAAHLERDWSPSAQLASGFAQTKNLLSRARLCASCHVGDRDRDMNHDIIAAGHPALHYEFATYQRRQPKHWRSGKTPKEDDEAYAWLVGQLASLDAFLTLLESRARTSHRESQWPELAVFDCSSCHQQLTNETYQLPARTNSSPTLSNWHRFGVQKFLNWRSQQPTFSSTDQELLEALMDLERTVKSPTVDALTAQQAAQRARRALDRWITGRDGQLALSSFDAEKLHEMVSAAGMDQSASSSWEAAAQFYLASITAREKWSDLSHQPNRGETVLETSRRLREALQFQGNSATPKNRFGDFGDNAINAPGPQSVRAHWQSLQKTISIDQVEGPR